MLSSVVILTDCVCDLKLLCGFEIDKNSFEAFEWFCRTSRTFCKCLCMWMCIFAIRNEL